LDIKPLVTLLLPFIYNILGWAQTAGADGVYADYEWKKLVTTLVSMALMTFAGVEFFNSVGIDIDALAGVAGSTLVMMFYNLAKKLKK